MGTNIVEWGTTKRELTLHGMIALYDIHMARQAILRQYTTLHSHFIVHIGMLTLGQLFALFLFDNFEGKYFIRDFVLTNDHRGEIALAKGAVSIGGFGRSGEFLDGGGAWL